ncbi:MAG: hypothetical protein AB4050_04320 [Synechococcus sp.]
MAPYALFKDSRRGFRPGGTIPSGQSILELTLYSENRRGGDVLGIILLSLTIGDVPPNIPPTITSSDRVTVTESSTEVLDINATDDSDSEGAGLTYALKGIVDGELFNMNANTGLLSFISPPDFENPTDSGADKTHNVKVTVTDSEGLQDVRQFAIAASDVDEGTANLLPTIATNNTVAVPENRVLAINVNATDDRDSEGAGLTYRLRGNGDDELFSNDANTRILLFNLLPDLEAPSDANSNNIYAVEVTVTDSGGLTDTQNLSVTVTDKQKWGGNTVPAIVNSIDIDLDSEAAGLTYSIIGGADCDRFQIDARTGVVSFVQAPQVATPEDGNGDFTYELQVVASDSDGLASTQDLAITVISEFFLTNQFDHFITHNDGNANDVDDISALVIQAALISAAGLQDRTTFFYNNNLGEPNNTRRGELFNEFNQVEVMRTSAAFAEKLGIQTYDYQSGIEWTTQKLVDILNSGQRVLILEGGPLEATYRALERVTPENLSNITVVSHGSSTFNQTHNLATRRGVSFARNQADILRDFPELNRIAIPNQNGPDKSGDLGFNSSLWECLDSTSDPILQEVRALMSNNDGRRASNDASDAGMVFYLLTGNETADPLDTCDFFQHFPPSLGSAPTLIAREPLSIVENQRQVLDLQTSAPNGDSEGNGLAYTISGGADRDRFKVDANGVLRFRTSPVFNSPNDADGDNIYEVDVTVKDSANRTDTDRLDIQVRPSGSPQIISVPAATVPDEQVIALDIDAVDDVDEERSGLLYSITGGADRQNFRVDATTSGSTGLLTFVSPPDVNSPSDANRDNIYEVEVTVTDSEGQTDSQVIRVIVGDGGGETGVAH